MANWFTDLLNAIIGRRKPPKPHPDPHPSPTPVPVPDPLAKRAMNFNIKPANATARVSFDGGGDYNSVQSGDSEGRRSFVVPFGETGGCSVRADAPGYEPYFKRLSVAGKSIDDIGGVVNLGQAVEIDSIELTSSRVELPRLQAAGAFFRTATGGRFSGVMCSDFQLYQRMLNGENIEPVLAQRADLGFNLHRVFGTCHYMFRLYPQDYGDRFFEMLPEFGYRLAKHGSYFKFVAFADASIVMSDPAAQDAYWARTVETLRKIPNVMLSLVNERNHPSGVNQINPDRFARPVGVLASRGSRISGDMPDRPQWDFEEFHYNDMSEWQRKTVHNPMEDGFEQTGTPGMTSETTRFPDRCGDPNMARAVARGGKLLIGATCFHSVRGKTSELWDGLELECARAWGEGARSMPIDCQAGGYRHRTDLEGPTIVRAYQRGVSDLCTVQIPK